MGDKQGRREDTLLPQTNELVASSVQATDAETAFPAATGQAVTLTNSS